MRFRIAAVQVSRADIGRNSEGLMPVGRQPVVMFRMVVIVVGVGVQRRRHTGHRHERRYEEQHQGSVHPISL